MQTKIAKLAETIEQAARTYDRGKKQKAINQIAKAASQVATKEERVALDRALIGKIHDSQAWIHYWSIMH
jgi:hypothetical protein